LPVLIEAIKKQKILEELGTKVQPEVIHGKE
jgi:hypothetical protein